MKAIKSRDYNLFQAFCTNEGIKSLEYHYGSLEKEENRLGMMENVELVFRDPFIGAETDSTVYFLSGKTNGEKSASTIEFKRISNEWYLNDYRMGK